MARVDKLTHMGNYGGKDFCLGFLGGEDRLRSECSGRALCSVFDFRRIETILPAFWHVLFVPARRL